MLEDLLLNHKHTLSRRNLLRGSAATAALGLVSCVDKKVNKPFLSAASSSKKDSGENYSLKTPLDLTTPENNLLAYVRINGDVSGKPKYSWGTGQVYGAQENELSKLLFNYQSLQIVEFRLLANGAWAKGYRGIVLMTDPETGKVIDEFKNPYTNEINQITHFKTSFGGSYYDLTGGHSLAKFESKSPYPENTPFIMPWTIVGDDAYTTYDERVAYKRRDGAWRVDNAVYRFRTSVAELTDPENTSPNHDMMWSTELNWFTYMNMGDFPGHIMWSGMGKKFQTIEELPKEFLQEVEKRYPGIMTTAINWDEMKLPAERLF